jgi:hypothetical protein
MTSFTTNGLPPPHLVQALGEFDLDPCASHLCPNKLATRTFGPRENGLKQEWSGRVWLNPPFSNMQPFVRKMMEHGHGTLLCLIAGQTLWQMKMIEASGWVFLMQGKPKFERPQRGLPQGQRAPVWLVPFGAEDVDALAKSGLPGVLLKMV